MPQENSDSWFEVKYLLKMRFKRYLANIRKAVHMLYGCYCFFLVEITGICYIVCILLTLSEACVANNILED